MNDLRADWHFESQAILSWWMRHMEDTEHGGFYGYRDGKGKLRAQADKGIIMHSRILWTLAEAGLHFKEEVYLEAAQRAYHYLLTHFVDQEYGGVYWMLTYRGEVLSDKKQVYAQAFSLYALSSYYILTKEESSLEMALGIFDLLERHSLDPEHGGYLEAFSREWNLLADVRLSEKDQNEAKTMNTHLHLLEAYAALFKALSISNSHYEEKADVRQALSNLIHLFQSRFINEDGNLYLFFDEHWNLKSQVISFGHDIEAAWLLWEAAEYLQEGELSRNLKPDVLNMIAATHQKGFAEDGSLWNEQHADGSIDKQRHWWPQVEAMVGCYLGYQLTGEEAYLQRVKGLWRFIQKYQIDPVGGEWHWLVDENLKPDLSIYKAGPWKAPYHNVRALLELLRRTA